MGTGDDPWGHSLAGPVGGTAVEVVVEAVGAVTPLVTTAVVKKGGTLGDPAVSPRVPHQEGTVAPVPLTPRGVTFPVTNTVPRFPPAPPLAFHFGGVRGTPLASGTPETRRAQTAGEGGTGRGDAGAAVETSVGGTGDVGDIGGVAPGTPEAGGAEAAGAGGGRQAAASVGAGKVQAGGRPALAVGATETLGGEWGRNGWGGTQRRGWWGWLAGNGHPAPCPAGASPEHPPRTQPRGTGCTQSPAHPIPPQGTQHPLPTLYHPIAPPAHPISPNSTHLPLPTPAPQLYTHPMPPPAVQGGYPSLTGGQRQA